MLGAMLWDFDCTVAEIYHLLVHTVDLMPEDECIFLPRFNLEILQGAAMDGLFHGKYAASLFPQFLNGHSRMFNVLPADRFRRAQRGLADLPVGRGGCYAAQVYSLYQECITRSEYGTDIIQASDIIEHHDHRIFAGFPEFLDGLSVQFLIPEFFHNG